MPQMPNGDDQEDPIDADGKTVPSGSSDIEVGDPAEKDETGGAPGDLNVSDDDDGGATVNVEGEDDEPTSKDFYENLADGLVPESKLSRIAATLLDLVEQDKTDREERDKQYAEGIKRTGLGAEAPGGAQFTGSSKAVHPVLIEGCIDFSARAMKEICPPQGPVRTQIIGKSTPAKVDKADRKRQFMNWQLTKKIPEYKPETEKMLTQLPMGGSQYKKWWYDHAKKRPAMEFVPIDNVFLPFAANSFYTAERITHWRQITEDKLQEHIEEGLYRDVGVSAPGTTDETKSMKATNKVEGKTDSGLNQDGLMDVYEISYYDEFPEDTYAEGRAPYIIHIEESSGKVLGLYRNWDEDDDNFERLHWIIESTFIPWRGAYGIGLPHIIGSLSGAITGSIRAILDNALAQTRMGGLRLKGGRGSGTTVSGKPTEFTEIDSGTSAGNDDIRKMAMFQPINQMSPVLFETVQWMVDQAKGVVATADEKIGEARGDMPVGTTLAMIEQGSITFSAIHSRLHESQRRELEVLHRLNRWFLDDKEVVEELGDLVISRSDFEGPMDIIPVSDPNIFSETQRYAQMQAVIGLMSNELFVPMFKPDKVLDRALRLMNVSNPEELLAIKPEAEDLDPVSENMVTALQEQPIKAFLPQDHIAHLKVHLSFAVDPLFGANPMYGPKVVPALLDHCFQHITMFYVKHMNAASTAAKAVNMKVDSKDGAFAAAAPFVRQQMQQELEEIAPLMQQAQQLAQQYAQQAQQAAASQDPAAAAHMAEVKRKTDYDQADLKLRQSKDQADQNFQEKQLAGQNAAQQAKDIQAAQLEQMVQAAKNHREQIEQQAKDQRERDKLAHEGQKAMLDAHTAVVVAGIKEHVNSLNEKHATEMKTMHDLISTHLQHQRETEANKAKAENDAKAAESAGEGKGYAHGGSVQKDKPAIIQQDPEHIRALNDVAGALKDHIASTRAQAKHSDGGEQAKLIAVALAQLGQHFEKFAQQQQQSNQTIAAAVTQAVTQAMAQTKQELRVVAEAVGAAAQGHTAVAGAFEKLDKTMRAPRKRVLTKDKKGNKSVTETIDDGEKE